MARKHADAAPSMSPPEIDNGQRDGPRDGAILAEGGSGNTGRAIQWFSWLFGAALLAAVTIVALHFSEEREFVRIAQRAQPWWLAIAFLLQGMTYLAQGNIWRTVLQAAGMTVPASVGFKLSLAKLFIDQALPSAGISGTVVVVQALERYGISRAVVMAAVVVDSVSYYGAYVLTLAFAVVVTAVSGRVNPLILAPALVLVLFSAALMAAAFMFAGRRNAAPRQLMRIPLLKGALSLLADANSALARSMPLLARGLFYHLAIVLLDAATVWVLVRSFGEVASAADVFTSFMAATLFRTISIVPGGLGVYEATSVVTLQHAGVSLPVALGATLLFRGLSFWLPMVPGLIFSRKIKQAS